MSYEPNLAEIKWNNLKLEDTLKQPRLEQEKNEPNSGKCVDTRCQRKRLAKKWANMAEIRKNDLKQSHGKNKPKLKTK